MDAFASCHRAHASVVGVRPILPSITEVGQGLGCMGINAKEEIMGLDKCLVNPNHPMMAIIGGAKISSKLPIIKALIKSLDYLAIMGAMAATFLISKGIPVGKSHCEGSVELQDLAREIIRECETSKVHLLLPTDFILADEETAVIKIPPEGEVQDIGPLTVSEVIAAMKECKTIFFNGPVGRWEKQPYDKGTNAIIDWLVARGSEITSVVCGGDTVAAVEAHLHLPEKHGLTTSDGRQGVSSAEIARMSRLPR